MVSRAGAADGRGQRQRASVLVTALFCVVVTAVACDAPELRPEANVLAVASPELLDRMRATPHDYFRFINHEWTARVCDVFGHDILQLPTVQLHGDAHVEQYALTSHAWGLDDFDDSTRGPALVDIVRFLGSIELAAQQRGWRRERDRLFDRFFAGYRQGLSAPLESPSQPDMVRRLLAENPPMSHEAFLETADRLTSRVDDAPMRDVIAGMKEFSKVLQRERPDVPADYFEVIRAGWLHLGIGSASSRKVLIRVKGASSDPADDVLLEAKAVRALDGLNCLEVPQEQPTFRIIAGSHQLGRLKHRILAAGPEVAVTEMTIQGEHLRNWWIHSWEPSYREIAIEDFRSVGDLSDIVYDSGLQLGGGSVHRFDGRVDSDMRRESLASLDALEPRLRHVAGTLIEEVLRGWHRFRGDGRPQVVR
jgi:Uncharacterized protein conserved in bacteria (DUF2252)